MSAAGGKTSPGNNAIETVPKTRLTGFGPREAPSFYLEKHDESRKAEGDREGQRDLPADPAVILVGIDPALDKHGVGAMRTATQACHRFRVILAIDKI